MTLEARTAEFSCRIAEFVNLSSNQARAAKNAKELSQQLSRFSKEPDFLDIAMGALGVSGHRVQDLVLVTSLLKDKFRYEFDSLNYTSIEVIFQQICSLMEKYKNCKNAAFENFSLCAAYIYINFADKINILKFLSRFLQENTNPNYFFKTLQLIADEITNSKMVIDDESRRRTQEIVSKEQTVVLKSLNELAPTFWTNPIIIKSCIIGSFASWVTVAYNPAMMAELHAHFVLQKVLECLVNDVQAEAATQCLTKVVQLLGKPSENPQLYNYLGQSIFGLLGKIDELVRKVEYLDAQMYIRMLCDFGQKSVQLFVQNYDANIHTYMSKLITYLKIQELDIFYNVIDFWEIFLDEFLHQRETNGASQFNTATTQPIYELVHSFYLALCLKCQYTWKLFIDLNVTAEEKLSDKFSRAEEIMQYRQESHEVFEKIGKVFGSEQYLKIVINCIISLPKNDQQLFWPALEVYLLSLKRPIKKVQALGEDLIKIVSSFEELSPPYVLVRKSYIRIFKSLMSVKIKNEQFIKKLFVYISNFLNDPLLGSKAEEAFCRGCEENGAFIALNANELIEIVRLYPGKQDIVRGICFILCSNPHLMKQHLPSMLKIQFDLLQHSVEKAVRKKSFQSLLTIIKTTGKDNNEQFQTIVRQFMKQIWAYLKFILLHPQSLDDDEDKQVENCVKLIKAIMRCLMTNFAEFLPELFQTVMEAYRKYPICSYIYVLEVSITIFHGVQSYQDYFKTLYVAFCEITYQHLKERENFEKYVSLVDDFLGMNKRFFIFNTSIVLSSGQLSSILQICMNACLGSQAPRIAKASYSFFEAIFMIYWSKPFIQEYNAETRGDKFFVRDEDSLLHQELKGYMILQLPFIIQKMIEHLSRRPLESTCECIMDTLLAQQKAFPQENKAIWDSILPKIPLDILTRKQKEKISENLDLVGSPNFAVASEATKVLSRHIYLLNKRLINSSKRNGFQWLT